MPSSPELLLSLPPRMCEQIAECEPVIAEQAFYAHDPIDSQLGSGAGTAYLLHQAWLNANQGDASEETVADWLRARQRIVIHGGGESRRLPAYAAASKLFIPIPTLRWSCGQRLGQTLLDLNKPFLDSALEAAGENPRVMIASGDVLLRSRRPISGLPEADVVLLGMWAAPEVACSYGVMFVDRSDPQRLKTFLQKPNPDVIRERSRDSAFLIDIGAWLLSERAVNCLMKKCGWDDARSQFLDQIPGSYDLYGDWALHLGDDAQQPDDEVSELSVAVAPVIEGEFYHFGKTCDVIESMYDLQTVVSDQTELGIVPSLAQPRQFIQDSTFGVPVRRQQNESLWVENCSIPSSWKISKRHMLTGVPQNDWELELSEGVCLDFVPIDQTEFAIRVYGFTDAFRGPIGDVTTKWMEQPAPAWFEQRGIDLADARITADCDLQQAAIFPVIDESDLNAEFIQWLVSGRHEDQDSSQHRDRWIATQRLSAREIAHRGNLVRTYAQREKSREAVLPVMASHARNSVFYRLDLAHAAVTFARSNSPIPEPIDKTEDLMLAVHNRIFRSEVMKNRGEGGWQQEQEESFRLLEHAIVSSYQHEPVLPKFVLADDQIVWGRSPARIDIAGGWTDTPPYCIEHGGSVVNIALDLNGQPPIQVFARRSKERVITVRSIDLGISEVLTTYDDVGNYRGIGSGFAVAKAALALCGFHPDFNGGVFETLGKQLDAFGGGIDLSMMAAIPKGSGLGTSSILSGTVLGSLNEIGSLGWDVQSIAARVSAVEQMLGSGGGWQDQFGGLLRGAKLIQTRPGLSQLASVRWLPAEFFTGPELTARSMLYYTGITRVAHDVLGEIVRGMFLNDPARLSILGRIRENSSDCFDAVQRSDVSSFTGTVAKSWELNQQLDVGTNPTEIHELIEHIQPHLSSCKLAGAGGGGFLYLIAKDVQHAQLLRRELENNPPNPLARFVDMSLSATGLRVTKS
ncbi:MAG: bifunctional fucokinase/fucose-1-phosphate guanylyltransferase [Rubripirellula sp.]